MSPRAVFSSFSLANFLAKLIKLPFQVSGSSCYLLNFKFSNNMLQFATLWINNFITKLCWSYGADGDEKGSTSCHRNFPSTLFTIFTSFMGSLSGGHGPSYIGLITRSVGYEWRDEHWSHAKSHKKGLLQPVQSISQHRVYPVSLWQDPVDSIAVKVNFCKISAGNHFSTSGMCTKRSDFIWIHSHQRT